MPKDNLKVMVCFLIHHSCLQVTINVSALQQTIIDNLCSNSLGYIPTKFKGYRLQSIYNLQVFNAESYLLRFGVSSITSIYSAKPQNLLRFSSSTIMTAETAALVTIAMSLASGLLDELSKKAVGVVSQSSESAVFRSATLRDLKRQLHRLERELSKLQALLSAAKRMNPMQCVCDDIMLLWLRRIKDAAGYADNILDEISYEKIQRQVQSNRSCLRKVVVARFLSESNHSLAFRLIIARKVRKFMSMTRGIYNEASEIGLRSKELVASPQSYQLPSPTNMSNDLEERRENVDTPFVIGRQVDEDLIVHELCRSTNDQVLPVFAIVGISGVGKTTLARKVYENETVRKHFDKRTWIFVSDHFSLMKLLEEMVQSLKGDNHNLSNIGAMEEKLQRCLEQKKYLLVLDGVWNIDGQIWDSVRTSLIRIIDHCIGSRVLLTTQTSEVASVMGASLTHHVEVLSDDDAWALFKEKAFSNQTQEQILNLRDVGDRVIRKCGGLPLAIKTVGCLLGSMNETSEWESVESSELWNSCVGQSKIMPWLLLSFNHLPNAAVKQCFAHCSVMIPKGTFVSETVLISGWMAQGYIQKSEQGDIETIGQAYIKALLASGLLNVENCHGIDNLMMHDLIHDLALYVSKDAYLIVKDANDLHEASRTEHLLISGDNARKSQFKLSKCSKLSKLRTLICTMASISINFVAQARHLRDLRLVNCGLKEVPSSIGRLKHLRSLNLSENQFMHLPKSVGKLYMLEILDLQRCYSLVELPKQVTKLVNLRHIYTSKAVDIPKEIGRLTCLMTLPQVKIKAKEGWNVKELRNLLHLRGHITIDGLEHIHSKEEAMEANLNTKAGVSHLGLIWRGEGQEGDTITNSEEVMAGLKPHSNLKYLWLHNFLGKRFAFWLSNHLYFANLEHIFLSRCNKCEQLPTFGQLRSLVHLLIDGMESLEVIGTDFFYTDDSDLNKEVLFPRLEELSLQNMPNLKHWVEPMGLRFAVLPSLEQLEIRNCPLLVSAPTCFQSLKQLTMKGINSEQPLLMVLRNTTNLSSLTIENIQHLTSFSWALVKCTSLRVLRILCCKQLTELPPALQSFGILETLEVRDCDQLMSFPDIGGLLALRVLKICWCKNVANTPCGLESCGSIETLELVECPKLNFIPDLTSLSRLQVLAMIGFSKQMSMPGWLSHLSCLRLLHIGGFSEELGEFPGIDQLPKCLKYLSLIGWPKVNSLSTEVLLFSQLVELCIQQFDGLEELPEWLGNLSCLEGLWIRNCRNLKYLPSAGAMRRLTRLRELKIRKCPVLEVRCAKDRGEEWYKISHLPSIAINGVYLHKTIN